MTEDHYISVIIPNYNYAHYVGDAIESVMAQTYDNFELIVVDNGSTDISKQVLEEFENNCSPQLRVIFQDNRGQAGSRNRGIEESEGDLIAFLDADDVWMPNKLEEQVKLMSKDNKVGLIYSSYYLVDEQLNIIGRVSAKYRGDVLYDFASIGAEAVIVGGESNTLIKKECFEILGLFDDNLNESTGWDMFRRISSKYNVDFVNEELFYYRNHKNNHSKLSKNSYKQIYIQNIKMFSDNRCKRISHLKNRGLSNTYFWIAKDHLKNYRFIKLINSIFLSIYYDYNIIIVMIKNIIQYIKK